MRLRKLARAKSTGNTPTAASLPQALATQNPRNLRLKCSGIVQHLGPEARPPHDDVVVLDCRRATGVHRTCPPAGMDAILSALFHQSLCLCAGFGHAPAFCGDVETQAPLRLLAACGLDTSLATRCLCATMHRPKDLTYCSDPACSRRVSSSLHVDIRVDQVRRPPVRWIRWTTAVRRRMAVSMEMLHHTCCTQTGIVRLGERCHQ